MGLLHSISAPYAACVSWLSLADHALARPHSCMLYGVLSLCVCVCARARCVQALGATTAGLQELIMYG